MVEISRGKFDRLPRTPAGFTAPVFDDLGLRSHLPARPAGTASYPVLVDQVAVLLHASFRPRLTATPLHFANPSPPSGWVEDLHLQAVEHARHTENGQRCCPFELALCSGKNYILQCSTAIGVAVLLPFLGVSSLNFGPLPSGLFS